MLMTKCVMTNTRFILIRPKLFFNKTFLWNKWREF